VPMFFGCPENEFLFGSFEKKHGFWT